MSFSEAVELVGKAVDGAGVAVIDVGVLMVTVIHASRLRSHRGREEYRRYRQGIGRAILLGLELLVAADIIRTLAVDPPSPAWEYWRSSWRSGPS